MAEERDLQSESSKLDWLVVNLRWLWLFLIAIFILAQAYFTAEPSPNFYRLLGLVGVGFVLNGIYAALLWAKFFPGWLAIATVLLDSALAVLLLVLFEDYAQFLLPLTLYPVIVAGARWNAELGILVAAIIILGYAVPLTSLLRGEPDRQALINALISLGTTALALLLAATLPSTFIRQRIAAAEQDNIAELERLRIENERGKLVSEMAITLSSTLNYHKVLRATVDTAFTAMSRGSKKGESAIGMVLLFEGDDGLLTVAAGRNLARTDNGRRVGSDDGIIGSTISTAEPVITHTAQNDKILNAFASTPGIRSAICAPLRAGFNTYGVIVFCSTEPRVYTGEHKELLATLSSQAIIALQNAQLFEDVHHEQQKILEQEAEARRKLARDLHDGPTQSVAAIVMRLNFIKNVLVNEEYDKAIDELDKVEEIAQRTTQEIRTMLFAMRPVILETQGLVPALNQYADRLSQNEPFVVSVANRGYDGQLSKEAEGVVFAIIEEAVGNAKKHANASELKIALSVNSRQLITEIRDNGIGFDVQATQATYDQRSSLGLINMDERAELVGGHCSIESAKGKGTTVRAEIPFQRAADIG
jgi:signal transduction histidine kinase